MKPFASLGGHHNAINIYLFNAFNAFIYVSRLETTSEKQTLLGVIGA